MPLTPRGERGYQSKRCFAAPTAKEQWQSRADWAANDTREETAPVRSDLFVHG